MDWKKSGFSCGRLLFLLLSHWRSASNATGRRSTSPPLTLVLTRTIFAPTADRGFPVSIGEGFDRLPPDGLGFPPGSRFQVWPLSCSKPLLGAYVLRPYHEPVCLKQQAKAS